MRFAGTAKLDATAGARGMRGTRASHVRLTLVSDIFPPTRERQWKLVGRTLETKGGC